ncbi:methylmalonyl Co-A mutase-associated GTPase MeaB [Candidatus Poriferisodalis sp.]|uniref:methylmalonyl Co-A mutase-associated GTPase MeaB n=1 Tax=Candidatus Poriferisodalis sp. TaxID=3101277 RepID=UPI003B527F58
MEPVHDSLRADMADLLEAARSGQRRALARVMSHTERGGPQARALGALTFAQSGSAHTVGITGAPGAGKSTLNSAVVGVARERGERLAVLAIDPSSPFSGGAILGDRVRMSDHTFDEGVYIRSMATRGHLGGLTLATPLAVRVLDALGWPWVVVETVGVGQVETEIVGAADTTVVVVNPGWGDSVQANKAGLMEIADIFVVNKADRPGASETCGDIRQMLDLSAPGDWDPPILTSVGTTGEGTAELWDAVRAHRDHCTVSGELEARRAARTQTELEEILRASIAERVAALAQGPAAQRVRQQLALRELDPYTAAEMLLDEAE